MVIDVTPYNSIGAEGADAPFLDNSADDSEHAGSILQGKLQEEICDGSKVSRCFCVDLLHFRF